VTGSVLSRRFDVGLVLRLAALLLAVTGLAWAIAQPGLYATTVLAAMISAAALAEIWAFVRRTNIAVARFVEAVTHGDFTQGFGASARGGGFDALGHSLDAAITGLRRERAAIADENRYLAALVEDVPSPLLSIDGRGRVTLLNKAARRLLPAAGVRVDELAAFGADFADDIAALRAGQRRSTRLLMGGVPTAALLSMAEVRQGGGGGTVRIFAVQPIQAELDRAELAAQTDLVRVLTHEIMNSMTPVTSLSATAAMLIAAADTGNDPAIADARAAIETVARRSSGGRVSWR
jgi:two-component system, NtrC family, nitrogen regulation sensor histidine kinase NtrY